MRAPSAQDLITQLADMSPDDELYEAKFTVLGEYVNHHVKEEQEELFPKMKKAKMGLDELGLQLHQRAQVLMADMGFSLKAPMKEAFLAAQPKPTGIQRRKTDGPRLDDDWLDLRASSVRSVA